MRNIKLNHSSITHPSSEARSKWGRNARKSSNISFTSKICISIILLFWESVLGQITNLSRSISGCNQGQYGNLSYIFISVMWGAVRVGNCSTGMESDSWIVPSMSPRNACSFCLYLDFFGNNTDIGQMWSTSLPPACRRWIFPHQHTSGCENQHHDKDARQNLLSL